MTDLKQIFEARRSVNFFNKQKELTDEVLKNIINLASLAVCF
jgi:putative NAD(P)H nitroreductase